MGQTNDTKQKSQPRASRRQKAPRFDSNRFIQYELDTAQQAQCKGWVISSDDLWAEVLSLVDSGYTVSLKYDTYSEAYACFIRGGDQDGNPNSGFILSGRGSTPAKAFKQACFKHGAIGPSWSEFAELPKQVIDD